MKNSLLRNNAGVLFALMAAGLWATTAPVTKLLLGSISNLEILVITNFFAALSLGAVTALQGKAKLFTSYGLKDYALLGGLGLIGVFLYRLLFQASLNLMPAQEAFILNYTWPIMVVVIAAIVMHEKLSPMNVFAIMISFIGVATIVSKGNISSFDAHPVGTFFALTGAVLYGLFSVLGKKTNYDSLVSTTIFYAFAFIFSTLIYVYSALPSLSGNQLLGLIWLGVFPSGLGFLCWSLSLRKASTTLVSNVVLITPFISLVFITLLLDEKIIPSSFIGLAFILAGILLQRFLNLKNHQNENLVKPIQHYRKNSNEIDIQKHYDRLAPNFDKNWAYNEAYLKSMTHLLLRELAIEPGNIVADLGGGTGLYSSRIAQSLGETSAVYCIDQSEGMLNIAATKPGITPLLSSAENFAREDGIENIPSNFDRILIRDAIHHMNPQDQLIKDLVSYRLAPEGRLLVAMLPTTLHLPLFRAAREKMEQLQPDPEIVISAMRKAGLEIQLSTVNSTLTFSKERYLKMISDRYLSVLTLFSDDELKAGIEEMNHFLPEQVAFGDSFIFAVGIKSQESKILNPNKKVMPNLIWHPEKTRLVKNVSIPA